MFQKSNHHDAKVCYCMGSGVLRFGRLPAAAGCFAARGVVSAEGRAVGEGGAGDVVGEVAAAVCGEGAAVVARGVVGTGLAEGGAGGWFLVLLGHSGCRFRGASSAHVYKS